MTALQTPALMVDRVTMKLEATSVFVNQDGPDNDVREILETVSTNLVKTMLIVLTYSKTSSACAPVERTESNVKPHLKDVSVAHACMAANAKTSVLASTVLALVTTPALAVSTNSTLVKLGFARTVLPALMKVQITPAFAHQVSPERTVMKISLTAKITRAHHLQLVLTYLEDSTANVHSTLLEMIAGRLSV